MNEEFREFKARVRKLDEILADRGLGNLAFAQALSRVHRAERRGDRSREPSAELRSLLDQAEGLAGKLA
jgi:hypothetical protein